MKDIFTTQEILLMTDTKFSAREYADKNESQPPKNNEQHNKLAEACWGGMMPYLLPELFDTAHKPLTIWQVAECKHLLYAHLGNVPDAPDEEFSLNPYVLMENVNEN